MLLQCGANVETINADGGTALITAIEKGHHKLVHLLLENEVSFNYRYPLYKKRAFEQLEGDAEHSIRHVRYPNLPIRRQVSPLWRAAERNDDAIMKLLLDRDAEMGFQMDLDDHDFDDCRQDRTLSSLMWATKHGYLNVVRLLIDAKDESGDGIMSFAAKLGHEAMISYLLTLDKIDADEKDEEGRTSLSYAAQNYCTEVVMILLASGKVDADEKDEKVAHRCHTPLEGIIQKL
jgi:ankyrin repeat protein